MGTMLHGTRRALLGPTKKNILKFDASLSTFTPSMAVRAGTVFAGAPIVQGHFDGTGTPDLLTFARGGLVAEGVWHDNFDPNQGTIVFDITPEWEGDDGIFQRFLDAGSGAIVLSKSAGGFLFAYVDGTLVTGTDISAWDAGTTYSVALRWDLKNTLDGTNKVAFSVNDAHTFTGAAIPNTPSWPSATIAVGGGAPLPANALIEGLTIYRRVLWDGAYGTDVNGGIDEIALISAGADPCAIAGGGGSWDCTFGLPTDSTPAALVTGEGNAWSHPHDLEIELDAFLDDAFAGGNWVVEATPLTPTEVEFDAAATTIIVPAAAEFQDLPDAAFTADIEFRADSYGESNVGVFLHKLVGTDGWACSYSLGTINFRVQCLTSDSVASYAFVPDKQWHTMRLTFDDGGDRKSRMYFDGILVDTGDAGVGVYQSDAGIDLGIGCSQAGAASFGGAIGRVRLCNVLRSATTVTAFVPDARMNAPGVDANSVLQIDMTDGAGAAATDTAAGGNDGVITDGAGGWLVTHSMALDAPGERVFHDGYVMGADAADEGFKQVMAGLAAGSNYVFRVPVHWGADSRGQPEIVVYDETNSAAITTFLGPKMVATHDGGDDSATLIDADGNFKQSQVGITLYNITDGSKTVVTAVSGDGTTAAGVLAGGTDNNWDDGDVGRFVWSDGLANHPWCETFTCQTPAGCVSVTILGLNAVNEGTLYWHEIEWLETADDDNPSLDTFTGANPDIPIGWTNVGLAAGESSEENTIVHSGVASMEFAAAADGDGISQQITAAIGDFIQVGLWSYCDGSAGFTIGGMNATQLRAQYSSTVFAVATPHTAVWSYTTAVFRVVAANPSVYILADAGAAGLRYIDDVVVTVSNPVSLTATPRTEANSVELGGLSIDGSDQCTQPTGRLTRTHGEIRFSAIPRHDMDEVGEWGNAQEYLVDLNIDGNNRLYLRRENTPRLDLSVLSNGAWAAPSTWNTAWAASAKWDIIVRWSPARMWGLVNGVERFSIAWASVFTADPATVHFGSDVNGVNQFDGVILP